MKEFVDFSEACDYLRDNGIESETVNVDGHQIVLHSNGKHEEIGEVVVDNSASQNEEIPVPKMEGKKMSETKKTVSKKGKKVISANFPVQDTEVIETVSVDTTVETQETVVTEPVKKTRPGRPLGSGSKDKMIQDIAKSFESGFTIQDIIDKATVKVTYSYVYTILKKNGAQEIAPQKGATYVMK